MYPVRFHGRKLILGRARWLGMEALVYFLPSVRGRHVGWTPAGPARAAVSLSAHTCTSSVVSRRRSFLGILHPIWLLQSSVPPTAQVA